MLGALPSYTQLGMAALLPGKTREIDGSTGNVILDSRSTIGTQNRNEIVKAKVNGRGTALQAEQFLELNTKTEGRALMRDHDVVYIYHNTIDAVGDSVSTEAQTVDAVERAFGELMRILKKIANINATNMILTSDHGFLFQQEAVADDDMATLPQAAEWTYRNPLYEVPPGIWRFFLRNSDFYFFQIFGEKVFGTPLCAGSRRERKPSPR